MRRLTRDRMAEAVSQDEILEKAYLEDSVAQAYLGPSQA